MLIGRDQSRIRRYGLPDKPFLCLETKLFHRLANHVPFAGDSADDHRLAAPSAANMRALVGVFVLLQSADKSFVNLDNFAIASERRDYVSTHRCAQAHRDIPCGSVCVRRILAEDDAMKL